MASWTFKCNDNGGKKQFFTVKAATKQEAILKGFIKAKKAAAGDIHSWDCKLLKA